MDQFSLDALTTADRERLLRRARAAGLSRTGQGRPPVAPREPGSVPPLSAAQERLWFLSRLDDGGEAYHVSTGLRISGELDEPALRWALDRLVARHEALRTTVRERDGIAEPVISPDGRFELEVRSAEDSAPALAEFRARGFDLAEGPLARGLLVREAADTHVLLIAVHHIVCDGWSMSVLLRELDALYTARRAGGSDPLPPVAVQYGDYARWQREWLTSTRLRSQAEYWRTTLAGAPALCEVPTDRPRPVRQDHAGGLVRCALDADLTARLRALSARHDTTLFTTLLAGWAAVLARLSGRSEVVVGTPAANRSEAGIAETVGLFANTLALRFDTSGGPTAGEWLRRVGAVVRSALAHQELPFEKVVEAVAPVRSLAHSPVYQLFFAWQDAHERIPGLTGLDCAPVAGDDRVTAKFDLMLKLSDLGDTVAGGIEYAAALYDPETVERYLGHWRRVLEAMADDDTRPVDSVSLLTDAEHTTIVEDWNSTEFPFADDRCVHEVFQEHAAGHPDRLAVVHGEHVLTYGELNARANTLAHNLRDRGVRPDDRVAICLDRGPDMVVAVLAVLKAGGAYVPLDPGYPADRLAHMVADSVPVLALTGPVPPAPLGGIVTVDVTAPLPDRPLDPPPSGLRPDHLAYVIYTSGSTGKPKGVLIEHRGVVNLARWQREAFGLAEPRRVAQMFSYSFDGAVGETVMALLNGGTLTVLDPEDVEPGRLVAALNRHRVNVLVSVPSLLRQVDPAALTAPAGLTVVSVGEACTKDLAERWAGVVDFRNGYGPTEYTVYSHLWRATPAAVAGHDRMPIGGGLHNTKTYVLDAAGNPQPVGVAGEIGISGVGIARGYLNRPETTAERFVPNPFTLAESVHDLGPVDHGSALAAITRFVAEHRPAPAPLLSGPQGPGEVKARLGGLDPDLAAATLAFLDRHDGDSAAVGGFCRYFLEGADATYSARGLTADVLVDLLGDLRGRRGVEFGCGAGEVLRELAAAGATAVGLDLSPFFVQALRRDGLDVRLARADVAPADLAGETGLADGSQDFAISTMVLDRVHQPRNLLANLVRVLRPGGRFALQTILPVVPVDDGDVAEPFTYTPSELRAVPGREARDDLFGLVAVLRELGAVGIEVRTLPYVIASRDGVQHYRLWSLAGHRGEVSAIERAYDRIYRTGDVGRWLADGTLDFLGRDDTQVKVRGFRVELGEVECALEAHPGVREAAVTAKDGVLRAYVATEVPVEALRAHVAERLPHYMVPGAYVRLDALPLTPNGKVDRAALPEPDGAAYVRADYTEPVGATETALAEVWADVLGVDRVGRHDDFFALGGHSLLAVRLLARVRAGLGVDLPLSEVFAAPSLAAVAAAVDAARPRELPPLTRAPRTGAIPVSAAQRRLWLVSQQDELSQAYHVRLRLRLTGDLDADALRRALDRVIERHEVLRTTFTTVDGVPVQVVGAARSAWDDAADGPFDLAQGPLIRAALTEPVAGDWTLVVTVHHIVADGWSLGVLTRELGALYTALRRGEPDPLPPLPVQYADYAVWQDRVRTDDRVAELADFWRAALTGAPELCELPADRPRPARQDTAGAALTVSVGSDLVERLRALARRHGTTLFMTVLAGWAATVSRLSGQSDVVIGTPTAHREHAETEDLIGFFAAILPLRFDTAAAPTVADWLAQVKARTLAAQDHQDLPFDQIVELLRPTRSAGHHPLFQLGFTWQAGALAAPELPGVTVAVEPDDTSTSRFDLTLAVTDDGSGLRVGAEYATAQFDESTVRRFLDHWVTLLAAMADGDTRAPAELPLLTPSDRGRLLVQARSIHGGADPARRVEDLVAAQARRTPDAVAVEHAGHTTTYADLVAAAELFADRLVASGVGSGDRVALVLPRSAELITAQLGVLKAGAVYVPVDPDHPAERRAFLLADSGARLVVTADGWTEVPVSAPALPAEAAYVMYTSGSTGVPKGVVAPNAGINRLALDCGYADFGPADRVAFAANPAFDAATMEVWAPLLTGGRVVVVDQDDLLDPVRFGRCLGERGVTVAFLTTSLFHRYATDAGAALSGLSQLLVGGDVLDPNVLADFLAAHRPGRFTHVYGPTETTTYALAQDIDAVDRGRRVPLGRPIAHTTVHVLDPNGEPAPVGVFGELHIGGRGLALGYLGRPELTEARFVVRHGEPVYRTGDLGRRLPDGTIEFVGRDDHQVKIRGFRVELGEIESALGTHPAVRTAAVLARPDAAGEKRLVAYAVLDAPVEPDALRAHLARLLPDYAVPAAYVVVDEFPLTGNGKLDRAALPDPDLDAFPHAAYEPPAAGLEAAVAAVWADVLGLPRIGRHDNFFDLGGHSLLAVRVLSRLRTDLGVDVALTDLVAAPTPAGVAAAIATARPAAAPIPRRGERERAPLSSAQRQLWFLSRLDGVSRAYHVPIGLRLVGDLDTAALRWALDQIVARHEVLRTTFSQVDGEPVQVVRPTSGFALVEHALPAGSTLADVVAAEAHAEFDLHAGPAVRGRLVRVGEREHALLITMHHIVSDGWSVRVLLRELGELYQAALGGRSEPPALTTQYADYAAWQTDLVAGGQLAEQVEYWRETLAGAPELCPLPTDRPRPAVQDYAGGVVECALDRTLSVRVAEAARRHGTTDFTILLAAWAATVARLSGQTDVVVGTPTANRDRGEVQDLIGQFVTMLPIRVAAEDRLSVADWIGRVGTAALAAQRHQDLPFERVVDLVAPTRSLAHTPLVQVVFVWQAAGPDGPTRLELPGVRAERLPAAPHITAQFDLSLKLAQVDGVVTGGVEYASALFDRATVARFIEHWRVLLAALVDDDPRPLGDLPLLDAASRDDVVSAGVGPTADWAADVCFHELVEAQVRRTPTAIATGDVTYARLDAWANQIAHRLLARGIGVEDRVGLHLRRGPAMLAGLLGVAKAGAAYVPLDPAHPAERLAFLVADSGAEAILSDGDWPGAATVPVLSTDPGDEPEGTASVGVGSANLAYVLYTSGSTGQPKGVLVEHRGLVNYLRWAESTYQPTRGAVVCSPLSFDATITGLLTPLLCGGQVRFVAEGAEVDGLRALLADPAARGLVKITPAHLDALGRLVVADGGPVHVDTFVVGGEALPASTVLLWQSIDPAVRLVNEYGPTETVVGCVAAEVGTVDPLRPVPIGRPITGTRVHVLDGRGAPAPVGVTGELHIGGLGVARGYLGRPELTAERFVETPWGRLYRSGDLARLLPDGSLEYLGRADHQVKLRGVRIEPGEIEAHLLAVPGTREAVVVVRTDAAGERYLAAYYTADKPVAVDDLRAALAARLPEPMVPSAYLELDTLPLTANGKVDRAALPDPSRPVAVGGSVPPVGPVETVIAEIWTDLLGKGPIGRTANFFELGGHSLLAVTMLERMRKRGVVAEVGAVFTAPDLAALAATVTLTAAVETAAAPAELVTLTDAERAAVIASVPGGEANLQDVYPLAPMQEGVLFHHLMAQEGDPYLLTVGLGFDTRDHLDRYLAAFQSVVDRHDILRTAVLWEGVPEPLQVVWRSAPVPVEEVDVDPAGGAVVDQLRARFDPRRLRLDVRRAPMLRMYAAQDGDGWALLMVSHHLMDDNTTFKAIFAEVRAFLRGEGETLPPPKPFRDFVAAARSAADREADERFFTELLGDIDEPTAPFGLTRVDGDGTAIGEHSVPLDRAVATALRDQARAIGVSPASLAHLAWALVLARVTGRTDVVFGTVLFGRSGDAGGAVGPLINTLPLRVSVGGGVTAAARACHTGLAGLLDHEHASLAVAQRCSGVPAPAPLFTSLLNYRHSGAAGQATAPDWDGIRWTHAQERTNYPLMLSVDDSGAALALTVQAAAPADPARVAALMATSLRELVTALAADPEQPVAELDVLPDADRADLSAWSTGTPAVYPDVCVHELIEAQAARTPDAVAVVGDQTLTYAELDARANHVARRLVAAGVQVDDRVAVHADRGVGLVIGLLACLKAGAAYVPVEPDLPATRLAALVADCGAVAVLSDRGGDFGGLPVIDPGEPGTAAAPRTGVRPDHLAYVIYTSGSTGRPKGVMVEHRSVVNRLLWMLDAYGIDAGETFLQKTPYGFDVSVWEFFLPLLCGARLVLAEPGGHRDPEYLAGVLRGEGVTTVHFVPSMLAAFLAHPAASASTALRRVVCSGEALPDALADRFHQVLPGVELHNLYGPTEAAVDVTAAACPPGASVTLGGPIANTSVHVVDAAGLLAPVGVAGELWIGGVQVARGYLDRPELTADRFIDNPFGEGRVYRTGDMVRWRPDGSLDYLGRLDFQVKVRGFRVEPGEVESCLTEHPSVREAVVVAGDHALVAYLTGAADPAAVREHAAAALPEHMVPAAFVVLDALPLTANGKVDRAALPAPGADAIPARGYEPPVSLTESAIARIWAELLGRDRVGRHDSFFELGGHSLLAITLMERMRREGLPTDVRTLYDAPTPAALAPRVGVVVERVVVPPNLIPDLDDPTAADSTTWELTL